MYWSASKNISLYSKNLADPHLCGDRTHKIHFIARDSSARSGTRAQRLPMLNARWRTRTEYYQLEMFSFSGTLLVTS